MKLKVLGCSEVKINKLSNRSNNFLGLVSDQIFWKDNERISNSDWAFKQDPYLIGGMQRSWLFLNIDWNEKC